MKNKLEHYRQRINKLLQKAISHAGQTNSLAQAMSYSALTPGKRLRAAFVYAAGECCQANQEALDLCATAIECMHTFSLIHDDLPAMDDDIIRRGQATCHVAFDEATAILAGDALQTLAFELLSTETRALMPAQQLQMIHRLAKASGADGMAGGQWLDIQATGHNLNHHRCQQIHVLKTGYLIEASVMLGLDASKHWRQRCWQQALTGYARHIGIAFQIQDDILDLTAKSEQLGKTAGKDVRQGKNNMALRLGTSEAKRRCDEHFAQACQCLDSLPNTESLRQLVQIISKREY